MFVVSINCYCEPIIVVRTDPANRFKKTFTIDRSCRCEIGERALRELSETPGPPGVSDEFGDVAKPVSSDPNSDDETDPPEADATPSEGPEQARDQRKRDEGSS